MKPTVNDYASAEAFLAGGRNKDDRPIENNTRIVRREGYIAVRLHETDVVNYLPNGDVVLNSGGWRTVTTKDRLNRHQTQTRVYSNKGRWMVGHNVPNGTWTRFEAHPEWDYENRSWVDLGEFFDGITLRDGKPVNGLSPSAAAKKKTQEDALGRRIDRFIDGYMDALAKGMPAPGPGDCWLCSFVITSPGKDKGKAWGDIRGGDLDHLTEHMKERYYVPSMLVNAIKEKGYGNPSIVLATRLDYELLKAGTMKLRDQYSRKELRRDLRRYMRRRLLPELAGVGPSVPGQPMSATGYYR